MRRAGYTTRQNVNGHRSRERCAHAIGLGARFDAIQVDLSGGEAAGLGAVLVFILSSRYSMGAGNRRSLDRTTAARTRWR